MTDLTNIKKFLDLGKVLSPLKEEKGFTILKKIDGKYYLQLSSSIIKHFFYKGNKREFCPLQSYNVVITRMYKKCTESMLKGLYFESNCLGATANDEELVLDLPRVQSKGKKFGTKTIDHERIDEQIMLFDSYCQKHGVIIVKDPIHSGLKKNVQIKKVVEFEADWLEQDYPNVKLYMKGIADIISPVHDVDFNYPMAVIDLKLTVNRNSTFGEFAWGSPQYMDHTQGVLYSWFWKLPFVYWIWDYNSKDRGNKFVQLIIDTNSPDYEIRQESLTRLQEMQQTIRACTVLIMELTYNNQWGDTNPIFELCKDCPVVCDKRVKNQRV